MEKTLDDEVTTSVDGLTSLMEPILIVLLGGLIGGLVVAFWLPILNAPKLARTTRIEECLSQIIRRFTSCGRLGA